jgi:hypothetical protein
MALTISGALHHPRFNENADIPKVDDGRGGWYRKVTKFTGVKDGSFKN